MRVLHIADTHIGADLPVRGRGRYARRGWDFVDSFRRVLAQAAVQQANLIIHAGDLFDRPNPSGNAVDAAVEPLWQCAQAGVPVVIVPGNHERSVLPGLLPLAHPNIHVVREPTTIRLECGGVRVAICAFPCIRRGLAAAFSAALQATDWRPGAADVNILALHQTFEGARCGPADYRFRAGEDVLACGAIPVGFDYVAAGHVHRHQVLAGGAAGDIPIVYAGSPDRIAFAEMHEPKGGVLVEFAGGRAMPQFLEHRVRPMQIAPFDVTGLDGQAVVAQALELAAGWPARAVVQVRLSGRAGRGVLRGLQLTPRLRAARPDVLASVSSQAVEYEGERGVARRIGNGSRSAFAQLDAPEVDLCEAPANELAALPTCCGVYACYATDGRLLYVGKALHVRSRLRQHLSGRGGANRFNGWTREIARIEARPAASELEALLIEADLIWRLRPPFNRQMRLWSRYCYLCDTGRPHGQLEVLPSPRGRWACGPLRSPGQAAAALDALCAFLGIAHCPEGARGGGRAASACENLLALCARYFAGQCAGPCAGRTEAGAYSARLRARMALLTGGSGAGPARWVAELAATEGGPQREAMMSALLALALRVQTLRMAQQLLDRPFALPAGAGRSVATLITPDGLRLRSEAEALSVLPVDAPAWLAPDRQTAGCDRPPVLPKSIADMLCTAAQFIARGAARAKAGNEASRSARKSPIEQDSPRHSA